ncbi:MAG: amino-acid N-acetyltransferase [Pseudomonadales bacterium]
MDIAQYARWFRSSTPYIQAHRGRTFVILLPGEALDAPNLVNIVHDIALTQVLGARVVLVHGARPQLDAALGHSERRGTRRVTRSEDLPQLMQVYGELRSRLEALFSTGLPNTPLHGTDISIATGNLAVAKPVGIVDGVDHQFTGQVRQVHRERVNALLGTGAIVLMSPIGYSPSGQMFNLPSDELAAATALAIGADKLIVLDEPTRLPDENGETQSLLSPAALEASIDHGRLPEATLNRLRAVAGAVRGGIPRAHVVTYQEDGALLAELYTAGGHGTQISERAQTPIRAANADDIAGIAELIRPLEEQGVLVRRSRDRLEAEVEHFMVAVLDGIVIGCCALFPYGSAAELACVAVHSSYRNQSNHGSNGIGRQLLAFAEEQARSQQIDTLFALTTQTQDWFAEQGFSQSSPEQLPAPKQALYNYQRNSKVMRKVL